jgi:transposase
MNYTYRIYPDLHQSAMMLEWLETSRQVYNRALRELKEWINSRKCWVDRCSIEREYIIPADVPFRPITVNKTICQNSKSRGRISRMSILKSCKRRFVACTILGKRFKNGGMDSLGSRSLDNSSLSCFHNFETIPLLETASICPRLAASRLV